MKYFSITFFKRSISDAVLAIRLTGDDRFREGTWWIVNQAGHFSWTIARFFGNGSWIHSELGRGIQENRYKFKTKPRLIIWQKLARPFSHRRIRQQNILTPKNYRNHNDKTTEKIRILHAIHASNVEKKGDNAKSQSKKENEKSSGGIGVQLGTCFGYWITTYSKK